MAFADCASLTAIVLPDSLDVVEMSAFYGTELKAVAHSRLRLVENNEIGLEGDSRIQSAVVGAGTEIVVVCGEYTGRFLLPLVDTRGGFGDWGGEDETVEYG
jgi:hypothetical protein